MDITCLNTSSWEFICEGLARSLTHSLTHSLCPRHVEHNNYVQLFSVDPIECRLTLYWLFRVKLVRPCQLQRIICSICAVIWYREPGGEPAQAAYLSLRAREARTHTANLYCNLWRGSLDGRTDDPTDDRPARVRAPPVCVWELDRRAAGVRTINRLRIWRLLYISARIRFGQKILASFAYSRLCSLVPYKKVRVILLNLVAKC